MKRQLQGIALIIFGLLLVNAQEDLNDYISYYMQHTYYMQHRIAIPFTVIGVIIGVIGLVLVFRAEKKHK